MQFFFSFCEVREIVVKLQHRVNLDLTTGNFAHLCFLSADYVFNMQSQVKKGRMSPPPSYTGGPRYSRTFYLRIRFFTLEKMVQKDNFPVKNGLFIFEFNIRHPI